MESSEAVHRVSCPGKSSAEERRIRTFIRTPSIHDDNPYGNPFFHNGKTDDQFTNSVLSEISGGSCNAEDEGIADTEAPPGCPHASRVVHSMSAPAGHHKPLQKTSFDSNSYFRKGKSLEKAQGLSRDDDDDDNNIVTADAETKARRESFKDSAYGDSGEGSTETCNTDDDTTNDGTKRRMSQARISRMVSDLVTVPETPEHVSDTAHEFFPKPHRPLSEQKTPDFDVLQPRSVCNSESSGSSSSEKDPTSAPPRTPGLHPLFEALYCSSASSMGSADLSSHRFDMDKEDCVFHNGYSVGVNEQVDIASLEPVSSTPSLGPSLRQDWLYKADGSQSPLLPPGEPVSLPSVGNLPMSEADLRRMYQRCRHRFQIQHIIRSMKRGEPFENILTLTQRIMSDSDHSSDFSSIGSGTHSLHSSNSGSMPDHLPRPPTMPWAPHLTTIDSVDSGQSVSRSCSFDSEGKLERAACCRQITCEDEQCQEGQKMILYIERFLEQSTISTQYHDNVVLRTIAEHADLCDELKCPIPWCTFFHEHDLPFEDQVANLHAAYFSGQINITSENSELNEVELLTRSLNGGCKEHEDKRSLSNGCTEHVDWSGIARLGGYGNAVLAMTSSLENPAYWVVKRENKDVLFHVDVLKKLKGKPHPRIVQHLWILEQENYLFIASKFEGASVADRMSESGQTGLAEGRVLRYLQQLASATQFLQRQNLNIAYLNWTAENILMSRDMRFVKLCNFSCAVLIEEIRDDEERLEDLKLLLPPQIVPPELYQGETVDAASDVWGLGCVWFQMTTGHLIYPQYCHFHPSTVREKLEAGPKPNLTEVCESMRTDLSQCLQMDPGARISIADLHTRLIELGT